MLLTRRFALAALAAVLALPAPIAARADVQETFTRLLEDVQAFRRAGFTLPRPAGVPGRYSRRMEDVSAEHYAREAIARLQAFRQHIDQPIANLRAGLNSRACRRCFRRRTAKLGSRHARA